jgi:hypothetical protein
MSVSYAPDRRNRRVGIASGKEGGGKGKGRKRTKTRKERQETCADIWLANVELIRR